MRTYTDTDDWAHKDEDFMMYLARQGMTGRYPSITWKDLMCMYGVMKEKEGDEEDGTE